jgi:hypothetical protein
MRQRITDPSKMCRKHLLGEHVELHMMASCINKSINLYGFINKGLINPAKIKERHALIVAEMISRGYRHNSELLEFDDSYNGYIDLDENKKLLERCEECRKMHQIDRSKDERLF